MATPSETQERFLLDRRYATEIANLSDDTLATLAGALEGELKDGFARIVGLSASAFEDTGSLGAAIREGAAKRRSFHDVGVLLAEPCTQYSIEKLGDSSEDPTLEDLNGLLPEIIEKFGIEAVRLMVIQYSRALRGFKELIAADERFALAVAAGAPVLVKDEAEQAAKRAARKARKAAKK
jgi:hypothetical protein